MVSLESKEQELTLHVTEKTVERHRKQGTALRSSAKRKCKQCLVFGMEMIRTEVHLPRTEKRK